MNGFSIFFFPHKFRQTEDTRRAENQKSHLPEKYCLKNVIDSDNTDFYALQRGVLDFLSLSTLFLEIHPRKAGSEWKLFFNKSEISMAMRTNLLLHCGLRVMLSRACELLILNGV